MVMMALAVVLVIGAWLAFKDYGKYWLSRELSAQIGRPLTIEQLNLHWDKLVVIRLERVHLPRQPKQYLIEGQVQSIELIIDPSRFHLVRPFEIERVTIGPSSWQLSASNGFDLDWTLALIAATLPSHHFKTTKPNHQPFTIQELRFADLKFSLLDEQGKPAMLHQQALNGEITQAKLGQGKSATPQPEALWQAQLNGSLMGQAWQGGAKLLTPDPELESQIGGQDRKNDGQKDSKTEGQAWLGIEAELTSPLLRFKAKTALAQSAKRLEFSHWQLEIEEANLSSLASLAGYQGLGEGLHAKALIKPSREAKGENLSYSEFQADVRDNQGIKAKLHGLFLNQDPLADNQGQITLEGSLTNLTHYSRILGFQDSSAYPWLDKIAKAETPILLEGQWQSTKPSGYQFKDIFLQLGDGVMVNQPSLIMRGYGTVGDKDLELALKASLTYPSWPTLNLDGDFHYGPGDNLSWQNGKFQWGELGGQAEASWQMAEDGRKLHAKLDSDFIELETLIPYYDKLFPKAKNSKAKPVPDQDQPVTGAIMGGTTPLNAPLVLNNLGDIVIEFAAQRVRYRDEEWQQAKLIWLRQTQAMFVSQLDLQAKQGGRGSLHFLYQQPTSLAEGKGSLALQEIQLSPQLSHLIKKEIPRLLAGFLPLEEKALRINCFQTDFVHSGSSLKLSHALAIKEPLLLPMQGTINLAEQRLALKAELLTPQLTLPLTIYGPWQEPAVNLSSDEKIGVKWGNLFKDSAKLAKQDSEWLKHLAEIKASLPAGHTCQKWLEPR